MTESGATNRIPITIGGIVLLGGLGLGLWPDAVPPHTAVPSATVSAAASAPAPSVSSDAEPIPPPYAPDLTGPEIGEVVVVGAVDAIDVALCGDRLVWLLTDSATLGSARKDGGDAVVVYSSRDTSAFGGTLATSGTSVWWSVETEGDGPESIFRLEADKLSAPATDLKAIATGTSPDNLAAAGKALVWSNLGRVLHGPKAPPLVVANRDKRIVSLAVLDASAAWIESPYDGSGKQQLVRAPLAGGGPVVWAAALAKGDRDLLQWLSSAAYWAESRGDNHAIMAIDDSAKAPRHVATTGLVTAMTSDDDTLVWAEAHGDEDSPTTILRKLRPGETAAPTRLGVVNGRVTAIALDAAHVFWSTSAGVARHPREAAPKP